MASLAIAGSLSAQQPAPAPASPASAAPTAGRGGGFVPPEPLNYDEHDGWTSLFDGKTLTGWDGNPQVWRVENGAIVATSTTERRVGSTYLIWRGGEPADFELKLEMKLDGDIHSGIAYRSFVGTAAAPPRAGAPPAGRAAGAAATPGRAAQTPPQIPADPKWTLLGPGLDHDYDRANSGNVEERGTPRREIAWRGGIVRALPNERPRLIGSLGDREALLAFIKQDEWNQLHIVARGNQLTHIINGHVMAILIDDDKTYFRPKGLIGIAIEQFGTGQVNVRNVWLKEY